MLQIEARRLEGSLLFHCRTAHNPDNKLPKAPTASDALPTSQAAGTSSSGL